MKRDKISVWSGSIGERGGLVMQLPRALIEPHEAQAQRNHNQDLDTLADRGGLSTCEAVAILEDRRWHEMEPAAAVERLRQLAAPPVSRERG